MKTKIIIYLAGVVFFLACTVGGLWFTYAQQRELLARANQELYEWRHTGAQLQLIPDTIRDSIPVVDQAVIRATTKELRQQHLADQELIEDLKLRNQQLEAMQTTSISTSDSVKATDVDHNQSVFSYSDRWADISLSVKDSTFYYNIRDSLETIVYREYKHRFLWWRWGTKGYRLKIVNFNPHARVNYNQYIRVED